MPVASESRTAEMYEAAFQKARALEYPEVDAFESRMGFSVDRARLEAAARVLACPLKKNDAHWQHGRVIYSATRRYVPEATRMEQREQVNALDIGTAKGFSALCLLWALQDAGFRHVSLRSVDVIDPYKRVERNTVAELDGPLTLAETHAPWPELKADGVMFLKSTGVEVLQSAGYRFHVAFVDGKHDAHVVRQEGKLLAKRQEPGDLAMFDDCQIPGVSQAVASLGEFYKFEYITAGPRQYAVGRRR